MKDKKGFTLVELLVAIFIATVVLGALLSVTNYNLVLQETSRNLVIATNDARQIMEEARVTPFANIVGTYNNRTFNPTGLDGRIRTTASYVAGSNNTLIDLRVVVCWRQANGRIIGEDTNLNGQLDAGEDRNNNGLIDSPAVLNTAIRRAD